MEKIVRRIVKEIWRRTKKPMEKESSAMSNLTVRSRKPRAETLSVR